MVAVEQRPDGGRPADPMAEIGSSGLTVYGGVVHEEFLPELQGARGRRVYASMAADPIIAALLFAIEMLLRQVDWRVEPADDTAKAGEAAEFVESCLEDMSHTWEDAVAEILSMLTFGWSALEVVYKRRGGPDQKGGKRSRFTDGRIGIRKLAPRAQETLERWVLDANGGVEGFWQADYALGRRVFLPIERLLLFRTTSRKSNPEGVSLLRGAYRSWYFRRRLEETEGIGVERDLVGLPVAEVPMRIMDPKNASEAERQLYEQIKQMLANVRQDKGAGFILPSDRYPGADGTPSSAPLFNLRLLSTGGQRQFDTTAIINRHDNRIVTVALADFILLGQDKVGSFALSSEKTALFGTAMKGFLDSIAAVFNRHLLPRLWALNGFDHDLMPQLATAGIMKPDLELIGNFVSNLARAGMMVFPHPPLEKALMEMAELPEPPEERDAPMPAVPPPPGGAAAGAAVDAGAEEA